MKIGRLTIEFKIAWEGSYMKQVRNYLREGKKLMAVKTYRDATGKSLKESVADVKAMKEFKEKM